ncbi:hypothetical protein [Gordonia malaquae]|uniref:hypothetical protein n=1 Tax=Gordonia malaquae TaxID=410332 RepID=UPI003019EF27
MLAAAVASGAALIVTNNVRDFPAKACAPHDVEILSADEYLLDQLDLDPDIVYAAMATVTDHHKLPPRTVLTLADALYSTTPEFGTAITIQLSAVPLLEVVDPADLPLDYDPTTAPFDPASAAFLWYRYLIHRATYPDAIATMTEDVANWDFDRTADTLRDHGRRRLRQVPPQQQRPARRAGLRRLRRP